MKVHSLTNFVSSLGCFTHTLALSVIDAERSGKNMCNMLKM